MKVLVATIDPNVALKRRPCDDGVATLGTNLGEIHLNAVWSVTLVGDEHAVEPILTKEGTASAPKLEPVTVIVPPSNDRESEYDTITGKS